MITWKDIFYLRLKYHFIPRSSKHSSMFFTRRRISIELFKEIHYRLDISQKTLGNRLGIQLKHQSISNIRWNLFHEQIIKSRQIIIQRLN